MLKAWEKVQKYAGEIANFKVWLVTLTRNLYVDNDLFVMSGITLFQYVEFIKGSFQIEKSEFISGHRLKYNSKFSSLVLRGKTVVLITGDAAIEAAGMTKEHARAFQDIADAFTCIIMSRSVNLDCTGLIEEGYASKGFKVKAKSCNWGPTAGFVLADPRLTKLGPLAEDKEKDEAIYKIQYLPFHQRQS